MIIHPKFIFAHLPKTGGTFIQEFLMKYMQFAVKTQDKHVNLQDFYDENFDSQESFNFHEIDLDFMEKALSFAFVRNPFDWYVSIWSEQGYWEEISGIKDFKEFVFAIFNKTEGQPHSWADFEFFNKYDFGLYTYAFIKITCDYDSIFDLVENDKYDITEAHTLTVNSTHTICDSYYRTENLRADLIRALDTCGIELPQFEKFTVLNAGRVNISDRWKNYRYYYDTELKDLILHKDRLLFELFDYEF